MKRLYVRPQTEVILIQQTQMICGSDAGVSRNTEPDNSDPSIPTRSRSNSWDDEEEEDYDF